MGPRIILFVLIVLAAPVTFGQPAGWVEVPKKRHLTADRLGCRLDGGLYDAEKLRAAIVKDPNCKDKLSGLDLDNEKESLIYYSAGSDCHMRVAIKVFRVDAERKVKFILNNIYGGCRAGGWRSGFVVIDKMPAGYDLEMHEVKVDRIHGPVRDEGFAFPKPPSVVRRLPLEMREVDLEGCLPLTGQSQWVLRTREHIEHALADKPNRASCLAEIRRLGVDLKKETLAGYSFASGHCGRPPDLEFKAVEETSSDPAENRFVVTATYDSAGGDACQIWTTWPVWLVVPRLPEGYRITFEPKPRS